MAINYSIAAYKKPGDMEGTAKYYAKAQASGTVEINELADDIAYSTTLTDGDVLNVIRALIKQINRHIAKGEIVKLENLGAFQAQIRSNGSETSEDFNESYIRQVHLQFRPGLGLQSTLALENLQFKKVKSYKELEGE
ncbi:HU family DNA-binding protein [Phocaeicola sp. HCN-6420]|uniref:HU family DNA-binding protein n=1 Tax=Phocaeicola sp. HCN-6420 TaxID=3134673 RepID=UPI0030BDD8A4